MKKVLWQEMRRTEIEEAAKANAVVIIPVGSIEQHGNHLPVNTDINCSFSIAKSVAEIIDDFPVLVAPPIWWGFSPHHMKYPGTISLKLHTYIDVLTDVSTSIAAHGFKKILFLNGHGGNTGVIASMRLKLMEDRGVNSLSQNILGYSYYRLVDEELKAICEVDFSIAHAGEMETSLQLYLQPELVDKGAATWAPGVLGEPTKATYEKGKRLFEAAVNAVVMLIQDYHSGKVQSAPIWQRIISPERRKYT